MPTLPPLPRPAGFPARPLRRVLAVGGACALAALAADDGADEPLAFWRFDEPARLPAGALLRDSGPRGFDCPLPAAGALVAGRRGRALRVAARRERPDTNVPAPPPLRNPTDSALNLGGGDWTIEGWLWLDAGAEEEGVWFEIGTGPREERELVTQLCLAPRENAVVWSSLAPETGAPAVPLARRIEFPDPGGPPGGSARLQTTLLTASAPLPRARWFHAAVVHRETGELRLFVDGVPAAVARAEVRALPRGDAGYLSLGCDGRGARAFPGAIDDLRVTGRARYATRFDPAAENPAATTP